MENKIRPIIRKVVQQRLKYKYYDGYVWNKMFGVFLREEVREFLKKKGYLRDNKSLEVLAEEWQLSKWNFFDLFNPERYYLDWIELEGARQLAFNVLGQFNTYWITSALLEYCKEGFTLLDHGCASAALTLTFQRFRKYIQLLLCDVENLNKEFLRYYTEKYPEYKIRLLNTDLNEVLPHSVDFILCSHVLEHLRNPSDVFRIIDEKIKAGGYLILEAPFWINGATWNHPDHLKEAAMNWKKQGEQFLRERYTLLKVLNPHTRLSGLYKRQIKFVSE